VRRAYERIPKVVAQWLREDCPGFVAWTRREKVEIYWGDKVGLRSAHQTGASTLPRGMTPVIPGTGQRFRCNVISAKTNRGQLAFMVFTERTTLMVFIRFLKRLACHAPRRIILIVDRLRVDRSAAVFAWITKSGVPIEIVFLPTNSPDLNPDEFLNQDVKSNGLGRWRPRDRKEMVDNARTDL
jgi:DDE superfamily endonuclease